MSAAAYVPRRGDFVWIDFNPRLGHEQGGRRPALVLSPVSYNRASRLALFCPVTSSAKGYTFEVTVTRAKRVSGVVLADHVKSLDWSKRQVEFIERSDTELVEDVLQKLTTLTERR